MPTQNIIDEICPPYTGEKRFVLQLNLDSTTPTAFSAVNIDVDYSGADPEGVVYPLELTILAPADENFIRFIYQKTSPSQVSFRPREGGLHVVRIAEVGHNRWFGVLHVQVAGDSIAQDGIQ
jgi:hypothetical protein